MFVLVVLVENVVNGLNFSQFVDRIVHFNWCLVAQFGGVHWKKYGEDNEENKNGDEYDKYSFEVRPSVKCLYFCHLLVDDSLVWVWYSAEGYVLSLRHTFVHFHSLFWGISCLFFVNEWVQGKYTLNEGFFIHSFTAVNWY